MEWRADNIQILSGYPSSSLLVPLPDGADLDRLSAPHPWRVSLKHWRDKRSLDANALCWVCISRIADAINEDKEKVYVRMLQMYGVSIIVSVNNFVAVEHLKRSYRLCEMVGEVLIDGHRQWQMLCVVGSSNYDTQEMSVLINGIMSEMEQMGLELPPKDDVKEAIDKWNR